MQDLKRTKVQSSKFFILQTYYADDEKRSEANADIIGPFDDQKAAFYYAISYAYQNNYLYEYFDTENAEVYSRLKDFLLELPINQSPIDDQIKLSRKLIENALVLGEHSVEIRCGYQFEIMEKEMDDYMSLKDASDSLNKLINMVKNDDF